MMEMVVEARRELSWVHQRRLGATIWNARRIAKRLKAEGVLAEDKRERAAQIAEVLCIEALSEAEVCATEYGTLEDFFNAVVAFIEKILPLIMLFL